MQFFSKEMILSCLRAMKTNFDSYKLPSVGRRQCTKLNQNEGHTLSSILNIILHHWMKLRVNRNKSASSYGDQFQDVYRGNLLTGIDKMLTFWLRFSENGSRLLEAGFFFYKLERVPIIMISRQGRLRWLIKRKRFHSKERVTVSMWYHFLYRALRKVTNTTYKICGCSIF